MIVVAGPPGSGKSSRFPASGFGVDWFNADDRAAELNSGSFRKISNQIRTQVNVEFHEWILDHITSHKSLALETTLRSRITFDQARLAHDHGFWTSMHFLLARNVEESIRRITERSYRGGHSASERLVRDIYDKSTKNLFTALDFGASGLEVVRVYDNSGVGDEPRQVLSFRRGRSLSVADEIPAWLESLFKGTKFEIAGLRGR